jgi:hypothetical protein
MSLLLTLLFQLISLTHPKESFIIRFERNILDDYEENRNGYI